MEKFTSEIENLLNKKLSLYVQLNLILKQERDFIVKIEVDSLWKSIEQKKKITQKIHQVREQIFEQLSLKYNLAGMDNKTFSMSYLIRMLPFSNEVKTVFRKIKLAIDKEKDQLAQAAVDNKKYVSEYLMVIDDIMSAVVDNSKQAQYNHAGNLPDSKTSRCLIHAEA